MYLIVNPLQRKEEQYVFLKPLLSHGINRIFFVSQYPYLDEHGRVVNIQIRTLFPKIPFLRGLFSPLFPYRNHPPHAHNFMLLHDEIFSSTMIHAVFAKMMMKSIVMVHCAENLAFDGIKRFLGFFFSRFIDCALCTNQETVEQMKRLGVNKVFLCPMPVEEPTSDVSFRTEIKRVGFAGRLVQEKGVLMFCEAAKFFPQLEFTVCGTGYLEEKVKTYPVQYKGVYNCDQLDEVFGGFDLLVIPSLTTKTWKEQFGRVIVEAMARGVIVIGSNSGAIPEVIGDERLIFQEGDPQAIVEKIRYLQSLSRDQLHAISSFLRKRFEDLYNPHAVRKIIANAMKCFV